jgi:hypothetical protein
MHPRVVDVLLPAGVDQKAVLGSFDAGSFARVPFVDGSAAPSAAAPPPVAAAVAPPKSGPELSVAYMAGNMISLAGPAAGVKQMQFGRVLGPDGTTVARVVVVQVLEGGLVVSAVENAEKIVKGARVRFDAPQDGR